MNIGEQKTEINIEAEYDVKRPTTIYPYSNPNLIEIESENKAFDWNLLLKVISSVITLFLIGLGIIQSILAKIK